MNFKHYLLKQQTKTQLRDQRGAVLVAVLVVSIILTLLLSAAYSVMSARITLATNMLELGNDKAAVHAKMQELIYIAATQRKTRAGIGQGTPSANYDRMSLFTGDELRVDGFVYSADQANELQFSIQDENGLISLNTSGQFWLRRYLEKRNISLTQTNQLLDNLADYADGDFFSRASGFENPSATMFSLDYIPNFLLQHPQELVRINPWKHDIQHLRFDNLASISRSAAININAMPLDLLRVFWPQAAEKIKEERNNGKWLLNEIDVLRALPFSNDIQDEYLMFVPNKRFILRVKKRKHTKALILELGEENIKPVKYYIL